MSGLRRMSAMRPNKIEYMSLLSKKENNPSSVTKNELNASFKKYETAEMAKHSKMWNKHNAAMGRKKPTGLLNFDGGKRRGTKRHGKKRSTRRHTRRQ